MPRRSRNVVKEEAFEFHLERTGVPRMETREGNRRANTFSADRQPALGAKAQRLLPTSQEQGFGDKSESPAPSCRLKATSHRRNAHFCSPAPCPLQPGNASVSVTPCPHPHEPAFHQSLLHSPLQTCFPFQLKGKLQEGRAHISSPSLHTVLRSRQELLKVCEVNAVHLETT